MAVPMTEVNTRKTPARQVPIVVKIEGAKEVSITGDFSDWKVEGIKLLKMPNGEWRTSLALIPGEYHYRLRVDGQWKDHAQAAKRVPNPHGSENCVLTVV